MAKDELVRVAPEPTGPDPKWQEEAAREALGRELDGALRRVAELKALPDALPHVLEEAEQAVKNVRAEIKAQGSGQRAASKRPKASGKKESR